MMKRSAQIALVLMGATTVGATSYALTPHRSECAQPNSPAARPLVAGSPAAAQANQPCRETRRWWSSSGHGGSSWASSTWSRSSSTQTSTSTALHSSSGSVPSAGRTGTSTSVARGGFGSTGHGYSSGS